MSEPNKTKNIYQRMLAIMADLDYIQKSDKTVNNQYRFVSHDQVTAAIHPLLVKHGVLAVPTVHSLAQEGNRTSVCLTTYFINVDEPMDKIFVESWGYGVDQSDKGPGKAVSYAFKYAILKTFCLETGDDPDTDATTTFQAAAPKAPDPLVCITIAEAQVLERFFLEHEESKKDFLNYFKIKDFFHLPATEHEKCKKWIHKKFKVQL